jgi:transglycosylase-like protein with SLT domain
MALRRPRNFVYVRPIIRFSGLIICLLWLAPVEAATCRDPAGFEAWLASFKREAAAQGISPSAIKALNGVTYDPSIISKDHGQRVFHQSFEQFAGRMVYSSRLHKGAKPFQFGGGNSENLILLRATNEHVAMPVCGSNRQSRRGNRNDPPMDFYSRSMGYSHRPVLGPGRLRAAKARRVATV